MRLSLILVTVLLMQPQYNHLATKNKYWLTTRYAISHNIQGVAVEKVVEVAYMRF